MNRAAPLTVLLSILVSPVLISPILISPGYADTVELSGGGHLSGEAKRKGEFAVVKVDDEIMVAIPASRVERLVTSAELGEYRERAAAAGQNAELHYQLAIWCRSNVPGNAKLYQRLHMERAVELDPDQSAARAWLGYKKQSGKWILTSELMRNRGMIMCAGHWVLPEAMAISDEQTSANVQAKKWIRDVKRLVKNVQDNDKKSQEAMAALSAIEDPSAATAIALQLNESRKDKSQGRELRQLWIRLLGRFRNRAAIEALVMAGVHEDDAVIREAALEQLVQYGSESAVATYLPMLKSNVNDQVNRAARALSWFPDSELALTYVSALVTEHKTIEAAGPGLSVGFGESTGGNSGQGLLTGGKPKLIIREIQNNAVLALLRKIESEVDYGYDEQQWLEHFARKRGEFKGDLRRDL